MKTKAFYFLLAIFLYLGCAKDDHLSPSHEFSSSLFVTVKDASGLPVKDAQLLIGDLMALTGEDGTYFFPEVSLTGEDYLQVEKAGYFKGSRRFEAKSSTNFVRITLLPKKEVGNFNPAHAATISVDNRSKIIFPAEAVSRKDGTPYQGQVHVMANPIYADDPHLSAKMPGELTGKDENGEVMALGSYGMIGVELQAENGEVLEITQGKTVEVQLAVPTAMLGQAPSAIALWYFDEEKGYWIQDGIADLQGNVYVAQLPHFSFWNCDDTFTAVEWEGSFSYKDGHQVQNMEVCLTIKRTHSQRCAITNAEGVVSGRIPGNEVLLLDVVNACGSHISLGEIGPYSQDNARETKKVEYAAQEYATISGIALQCDGSPLSKGFVNVNTPSENFIFAIQDDEGHFQGGYVYCTGDRVTLTVYDTKNALASYPQVINFERTLAVGSIKACDQPEEFLRYSVKGFSPAFIYYFPDMENQINTNSTRIFTLDSIGFMGKFGFWFTGVTTGHYPAFALHDNQINLPNGQTAFVKNMTVDISEYGNNNGYVKGTFSGKLDKGGNGAGGPGDSEFSGSFSVRNN